MAAKHNLKRSLGELKRTMKQIAQAAHTGTGSGDTDSRHIHIAGKTNIVSTRNVGGDRSLEGASSKQSTRIRQHPAGTSETVVSEKHSSSAFSAVRDTPDAESREHI